MADEEEAIGEVSVEDGEQGGNDESDGLGDVIVEGLDDAALEDGGGKQAEKKAEKKEVTIEDFEKMKALHESASSHIRNLEKALSEERKTVKELKKETKTEETPQLSKEQLKGLMKEYADDPDTMFNIINYMTEQAAKGASSKAIETAKVGENKKQVDAFLSQNYPDLSRPESELRTVVEKTKGEMGLDEHPYGDFIAVGVQTLMNMPKLMQQAYQQGRKDESGGKAEKTRKEIVKESGLTPKGKGSIKSVGDSLSESQMETAKKLGLKGDQIKTFSRIINKGASTVTMGG